MSNLVNSNVPEILATRVDQQKQAVGIVASVIDPNGPRVVAHGHLAAGDPRTLDGDAIFEIGSVTKIFTSLALADMAARRDVALDDPAARYLPETAKLPERNGKAITLLHLSTHTSGLPRLPANLKPKNPRNPYADYTVDDLYRFLSTYSLARDPGAEFEYSNLGGGLLGHVLALRDGTDYETLVRSRITQPLGMPDTAITLSSSMKQRMATGHTTMLAPAALWDLPTLAGAGALRSSANDLLTFLEAFLGYHQTPLAPAVKDMLAVRRLAGHAKIGLGWLICAANGQEIVWHNGGTGGFRSFLGFDPNRRVGVVVLANAFTLAGVDDIGFHLLNPNLPLANPEPPKQRTKIPIDPDLLANYTGRYQVTPNLIFDITRDGARLFAQGFARSDGQPIPLPRFELFAESEQRFFARVADHQFTSTLAPTAEPPA